MFLFVLSFRLSVVRSVCEQDNSQTRKQTLIKRGRCCQGLALKRWLYFSVEPDLWIVDHFSVYSTVVD